MKWYDKPAPEEDAYVIAHTLRRWAATVPQLYNEVGSKTGMGEARIRQIATGNGPKLTKLEFGNIMSVMGLYVKETRSLRLSKPIPRGDL